MRDLQEIHFFPARISQTTSASMDWIVKMNTTHVRVEQKKKQSEEELLFYHNALGKFSHRWNFPIKLPVDGCVKT